MQIIDFVRAKVAAGGELGAKLAGYHLNRWDRSPYVSVLRIQRAVSVGITDESVGLRASN